MAEYVVIPKSELEKVEAARVALYELLEEQAKDTAFLAKLTNITAPIWHAANRKWPELMGKGEAALEWLPMETCPNNVDILISRDNGAVEFVTAIDNDYMWQPYKGPRRHGIDRPNGWMPVPTAKPLRKRKGE